MVKVYAKGRKVTKWQIRRTTPISMMKPLLRFPGNNTEPVA